ncbi:hypothetical protein BH09CHL1_BH09CHL1_37060 [soil metagenome]
MPPPPASRQSKSSIVAALRWLRFIFIFPIYSAYRRRTEEELRWRLAFSHVSAVLLSVALISVVGASLIVGTAIVLSPAASEPARDARAVANLVNEAEQTQLLDGDELSGLLASIQGGLVEPSHGEGTLRLRLDFPVPFRYLKSISIVSPSMSVLASSDTAMVGQGIMLVSPDAYTVTRLALAGNTNTRDTSVVRADDGIITGAYPLYDETGAITGAVVIDKTQTAVPHGFDMLQTALLAMGEIGVVLAIFVAIPAVPVAIITGFRRARSISEPVEQLAVVAGRVARGDLSARVEVTGQDEIARLETEFNQMADQLGDALKEETTHRARAESLLEANRSLISNVSHELRTPVAVVRSHLEALLAEPEQGEEYARIALREIDRLNRLVEDLFQLTRLESKGLQITSEPIDAAATTREAFESLAEPARREAGITMICETPDKPLMAMADRARIVQVLQNLIRNAIRHTPEGGIILVSAEREPDGDIALQVFDTGEGIPPEHLPKIFDRFYRADPSRTHSGGGGAGLGLAIAKELISAMGGTISVESDPGEGAAFTIRLRPAE